MRCNVIFFLIIMLFSGNSFSADREISYICNSEFIDIIMALSKVDKDAKRGEFETKDDFKKRIDDISKEKVKEFNLFVQTYDHFFTYNIDKGKYFYSGMPVTNKRMDIEIFSYTEDRGGYIGNNAFGVSRNIKNEFVKLYILRILNIPSENINKWDFVFNFKVTPEIAKQLKNNMMLVYNIVPVKNKGEYVEIDHDWHTPTIDSPYKRETEKLILNSKIKQIFVLNRQTIELIAVVPFK